jgi:glutathione S-transferase
MEIKTFALPALATALALIVYFAVTIYVGVARAKYKVPPPQVSGNPDFERVLRVQQNTLEQLVLFIPALWLFSLFVSPIWGAVLGFVWIVGRVIYAWGYYQAAEKRLLGFAIGSFGSSSLILGALIGVILSLLRSS